MASRRNRLASSLLVSFVLLVPGTAFVPLFARADAPASSAAVPKKPHDTTGAAPGRDYSGICSQGNAKFAARDFDGAIALFRKAIEMSPQQALGHYLLGEAQLAAGNTSEAEASWGRALEASDKDPALHTRVLFVVADLKERQKKWADAKAAWQAYLDWAARYPNVPSYPASAMSRQQVLDAIIKQDASDEIVRQRIAATQDGGVFSDPSKTPPAQGAAPAAGTAPAAPAK